MTKEKQKKSDSEIIAEAKAHSAEKKHKKDLLQASIADREKHKAAFYEADKMVKQLVAEITAIDNNLNELLS